MYYCCLAFPLKWPEKYNLKLYVLFDLNKLVCKLNDTKLNVVWKSKTGQKCYSSLKHSVVQPYSSKTILTASNLLEKLSGEFSLTFLYNAKMLVK